MSFRKREREYEAAERKYRNGLIRIVRQAFLIQPPRTAAGLRSINITKELKRPTIKNKINTITAALFDTGTKHATELIEELIPKRLSAAYQAAATIPYNQQLINNLTDHTITNMAYIAEDVQKDLITSLEEGYTEGEGIPALTKRVQKTWNTNKTRAVLFARTFTNEVYNQAHLARYQDSPVVDAIQFSAHLDSRTSDQCRMLNKTIWRLNDPAIQRPPLHYNCRSRIIPYFGSIPGKRDFSKSYDGVEYSKTDIAKVQKKIDVFRSKYWKVPLKGVPKIPIGPRIKTDKKLIEDTSDKEFYHITNNKNVKLSSEYEQQVQEFGKGVYITDTDHLKFWNRQMQGRDYAIKVNISDIKIIREEMMPSISKMSKDLKSLGYSGSDITKLKPTVGTLRTNPMDIAIKRTWAKEAGFQGIIPKIRTADSVEQYVLFNIDGVTFGKPVDTLNLIKRLNL